MFCVLDAHCIRASKRKMKDKRIDCGIVDSYSTIRVRTSTLKKLWLYKRIIGLDSLNETLLEIMSKPDLLGYLVDRHQDTSFELANLNLSPNRIELDKNKTLVKDDE